MPIELPVVFWLSDNPDASYTESLDDMVRRFRPYAKAKLSRHLPPNSDYHDPQPLVYQALWALQLTILGQYLPRLEPGRTKGVGCVWPWWETGGVKVEYGEKRLHTLRELPEANGELVRDILPDGVEYQFTFYRNDTIEQRQIWFRHFIEEEARKEARESKPGDRAEELVEVPDQRPNAFEELAAQEWFRDLIEITDGEDWKRMRSKESDVKARKRRSAARERLLAAVEILKLRRPAARSYLETLRRTEDGGRGTILNRFILLCATPSNQSGGIAK